MNILLFTQICLMVLTATRPQNVRRVGKFEEVYAWKDITYNIKGMSVLQDRFADFTDDNDRMVPVQSSIDGTVVFVNDWPVAPRQWKMISTTQRPPARNPSDDIGRFYIKYNNLPMGVEKVGNRLFVTIPRRRYGIPATLNYIDLSDTSRSPSLSPYPNMRDSRSVISVYRTRADQCGRLWAVDTGAIEIPNNVTYLRPPSIVVYDLRTNKQIMRYQLKSSVLPATNTPTGLASITVELRNGDCSDAFAYIVDLTTYGIITYSLRENDSWRHNHNYFSFNPTSGNLMVSGQSFMWNDGVFSVTLGRIGPDGCRPAYFHPMVSTQEFMVPSCELQKRTADSKLFTLVGDRGQNSQSTMHALHEPSNVIFFADVGRNAISCWNVNKPLTKDNIAILASDEDRMSYPSDIHVTGDEVWAMANKLPRFVYSTLDSNEYNFYVYRAKVKDLISGTVCDANI